MKLRPLSDRVVVRRDEAQTKRPSGILLPDSAKDKPLRGTVLAVGPGKSVDGECKPLQVSVGDRVLFPMYGAQEVEHEGETLLVLDESQVLAVLE